MASSRSPYAMRSRVKQGKDKPEEVDDDILRCVSHKKIASNFGFQLRSGPKGSEETFQLSQPVDGQHKLEVFLSHSWRDSGFLK